MSSRSPRPTFAILARLGVLALLTITACDKGEAEGKSSGEGGSEPAAAAEGSPAAASPEGPTAAQLETFAKDQRTKGCEMLSPALVAKQFEVPEAELEQMKISGCIYGWNAADRSQTVEASIMTIFVHDDAAKARQWFDNTTKSVTAEEARAQLGVAMDAAKESDAIDTKPKAEAVDGVGGMMGAMIPDAGYQYEDVAGVGDAARVLTHDGKLTVLVGNMVFTVGAYKGAPAPDIDLTGIDLTDTKALMAASKKVQDEHLAGTRELRKQQAIELAKAIVAGL